MTDAFPARERPDVHSRRVPASGAGIRPATGADDAGSRPGPHLAALEPTAPPPAAAELTAPEPTAPPVTSEPRERSEERRVGKESKRGWPHRTETQQRHDKYITERQT